MNGSVGEKVWDRTVPEFECNQLSPVRPIEVERVVVGLGDLRSRAGVGRNRVCRQAIRKQRLRVSRM